MRRRRAGGGGGRGGGGVKRIIELILQIRRNKKYVFMKIISKRLPQQVKKREKKEFIVYIL